MVNFTTLEEVDYFGGESSCTLADTLTTGVSKVRCNVGAAGSSFPCVGERCSSALHQPTNPPEVITHYVIEVSTQTCWVR